MMTYITAFIFYTLAMIGILLIGFVVYKKTIIVNKNDNKGTIKVIDSLMIAPKKMLLVVKIKNEKFLIASGAEHTTFLSKLENDGNSTKQQTKKEEIEAMNALYSTKFQKQEPNPMDFYSQEPQPKQEIRYDDIPKRQSNKIQQQFMDLYNKDEQETKQTKPKQMDRRELIKHLLKDLNETNTLGSKF